MQYETKLVEYEFLCSIRGKRETTKDLFDIVMEHMMEHMKRDISELPSSFKDKERWAEYIQKRKRDSNLIQEALEKIRTEEIQLERRRKEIEEEERARRLKEREEEDLRIYQEQIRVFSQRLKARSGGTSSQHHHHHQHHHQSNFSRARSGRDEVDVARENLLNFAVNILKRQYTTEEIRKVEPKKVVKKALIMTHPDKSGDEAEFIKLKELIDRLKAVQGSDDF
jgi:hypothetical protein